MHKIFLARIETKEKWSLVTLYSSLRPEGLLRWLPGTWLNSIGQSGGGGCYVSTLLRNGNILPYSSLFPAFSLLLCHWCCKPSPAPNGVWLRNLHLLQAHQDIPLQGSTDSRFNWNKQQSKQYNLYRVSPPKNIFLFILLALSVYLWILEKKLTRWNVSPLPTLGPWKNSVIS